MKTPSRRNFLKRSSASVAAIAASQIFGDKVYARSVAASPDQLTILFQGDSITDAGRDRSRYYPNEAGGMGRGYVFQTVSHMLGIHPDKNWKYYNRGISGNKVYQLADRWEDDCLQLKPDVLSILIGVNDFWHTLNNYDGTAATYDRDLRALLQRTMEELPDVKLIIGEPFAVKGGRAISEVWNTDFPAYQQAAKHIARDFSAKWIPYQQIFDEALEHAPVDYWCPDGVHPSMAGGYLMKEAWLMAFEKLFG